MQVIDSGVCSATQNMQKDSELLKELRPDSKSILHLYEWESNAATYGYFTNPYLYLSKEGIAKYQLDLARRPTGGGIIFHLTDYAFSILIPSGHPAYSLNTLENYAFINRIVIDIVMEFLGKNEKLDLLESSPPSTNEHAEKFCMAHPTKYDVFLNGKKVGGAAQRRTKNGFLHQGTLSLCPLPESFLENILLQDQKVVSFMKQNSATLLKEEELIPEARQSFKNLLIQKLGIYL